MYKYFIAGLTCFFIACAGNKTDSFSFNEKDYKFGHTEYIDGNKKIGDVYVNKEDDRITLAITYWDDNNTKKSEHFIFNHKELGPQRLYDLSGKLVREKIEYGDLDSTKYIYLPEKQVMQRKSQ